MAPPIKLSYFNGPALGEPIRFLLAYGNLKFEDERFDMEGFQKVKESFPYGKVPVLEIEGKTLHQTSAICRYLAKKVGLIGKTEWDSLQCDVMVDTINDFRAELKFGYEKDLALKAEQKKVAMSTTVPFYLAKFEDHLSKNGGHFVNSQLTWADFYFTSMSDYFSWLAGEDLFKDRPALRALRTKVDALPGIAEYLANRPKSLIQ